MQHHIKTDKTDRRHEATLNTGETVRVPTTDEDQHPEEETTNLQQLALQQLQIVDINNIAVIDNESTDDTDTPILTLVSDPFWNAFNEWKHNNNDAYQHWLNTRFDIPNLPDEQQAGDNALANQDNNTNESQSHDDHDSSSQIHFLYR